MLHNTDYNEIPPNPTVGFETTHDGAKLRYAHWKTLSPPTKGTVVLLGGRAEFIEKNFETVSDLREKGYDVLTFDWRGQGGSDRMIKNPRKGFVENFDQYVIDLDTIITQVALPDCRAPYFVLAHSTGSLVALLATPLISTKIERMVLGSPLIGLKSLPFSQTFAKYLTGFLHVIGLGKLYASGGSQPDATRPFAGNKLTSDIHRFNRNKKLSTELSEVSIGGPTASWVFAACRAMDSVTDQDYFSQFSIPTLLISASADRVVDNKSIEYLGKRMRSGKMLSIKGAKHELLQERDIFREQLLAAFYAFAPGSKPKERKDEEKKSGFFNRKKSA